MTGSWNMQYANKCNETHLSQDRKGKKKPPQIRLVECFAIYKMNVHILYNL